MTSYYKRPLYCRTSEQLTMRSRCTARAWSTIERLLPCMASSILPGVVYTVEPYPIRTPLNLVHLSKLGTFFPPQVLLLHALKGGHFLLPLWCLDLALERSHCTTLAQNFCLYLCSYIHSRRDSSFVGGTQSTVYSGNESSVHRTVG